MSKHFEISPHFIEHKITNLYPRTHSIQIIFFFLDRKKLKIKNDFMNLKQINSF